MTECTHQCDLESFDTRTVGRLCDACLAYVYEAVADDSLPPHDGPDLFAFVDQATRERVVAAICGASDPSPEEAHLIYLAAKVVATCDDAHLDIEKTLTDWMYDRAIPPALADALPASPTGDYIRDFLDAVDTVIEIADA